MGKSAEFIKEIDQFTKKRWLEIYEKLKDEKGILELKFIISVDDDFRNKYELNDDICFVLDYKRKSDSQMEYYYKGNEIKPECYYIRPDDYHPVTQLQMLQECIRQDRYDPDIKHLERGENSTSKIKDML